TFSNSFTERKLVCWKAGLPKLHTLEFTIRDIYIILRSGSLKKIICLINDCRKLKSFPDGLRCITSLEKIRVGWMENAVKDMLIQGGKDYYRVQHASYIGRMRKKYKN
ncbi:hypothetical protein HID58_072717, partial [Brassica napus]